MEALHSDQTIQKLAAKYQVHPIPFNTHKRQSVIKVRDRFLAIKNDAALTKLAHIYKASLKCLSKNKANDKKTCRHFLCCAESFHVDEWVLHYKFNTFVTPKYLPRDTNLTWLPSAARDPKASGIATK